MATRDFPRVASLTSCLSSLVLQLPVTVFVGWVVFSGVRVLYRIVNFPSCPQEYDALKKVR